MTILLSPAAYQFTEFHDLLLPELPGCTVAMLNLHLRQVVREFCAKTSAWREPLTAVNTVAAQAAYTLTPPADSELVRVTKLTVNSVFLWRHTDRQPAGTDTEDEPEYTIDEPPFTLDENLAVLTMATDEIPAAAVTGGLVVEAALKPTEDCTTIPAFLFTQYSEPLRHGTLSRLMLMAKKPWTDRELATEYGNRYQAALNFAAYQAQVGNTRRPLRVRKWG